MPKNIIANGSGRGLLLKNGIYQGSSLAKRLNVVGTIMCILDTSINMTSTRSNTVSRFFNYVVPYYVMAFYYVFPSVALLLAFFKSTCTEKCSAEESGQENMRDISTNKLITEFNSVDGFSDFLSTYPRAEEEMVKRINQMQHNRYIEHIDIFINVAYFTLRALQGGLLIMKAHELTSGEIHDTVKDWSDLISNIITVAYLFTMLIHNNCNKHQFGFFSRAPKADCREVKGEDEDRQFLLNP